jgi:hypothetical protein
MHRPTEKLRGARATAQTAARCSDVSKLIDHCRPHSYEPSALIRYSILLTGIDSSHASRYVAFSSTSPVGFHRIRYSGLFAKSRAYNLARAPQRLNVPAPPEPSAPRA